MDMERLKACFGQTAYRIGRNLCLTEGIVRKALKRGQLPFIYQCLAEVLSEGKVKVTKEAIQAYKKEAEEKDRLLKHKTNAMGIIRRAKVKELLAKYKEQEQKEQKEQKEQS